MRTLNLAGRGVAVAASDDEGREALEAVFRGFARQRPTGGSLPYRLDHEGRRWIVKARGVPVHDGESLTGSLMALEWHMLSAMLERLERFHLHGAALSAPDGRNSVLLVGASGVGKTMLTLALIARGYLPYTDDVIIIDAETLAPATFPRAFHLDHEGLRLLASLPERPAVDFGGLPPGFVLPARWARVVAPVRAMVFPIRGTQVEPQVRRLSISEAVAALLSFSATMVTAPEAALRQASRLTREAKCYALSSGDLSTTASLVESILTGDADS